jgi:uncharacterized membrane protein YhaH (DUF805 family)
MFRCREGSVCTGSSEGYRGGFPMQWYLQVLKNYAGFSGRARRKEYWMFTLVNILVLIVLSILGGVARPLVFLAVIYDLAMIVPSLAVSFRRLHDTGRSAGWIWIGLIPVIGAIVLIVFTATDGQRGPNKYGPDPKENGYLTA